MTNVLEEFNANPDKKIVIGHKIASVPAIDHTPIHTFVVHKNLQPGDLIEWDTATSELIYKGNSTSHA